MLKGANSAAPPASSHCHRTLPITPSDEPCKIVVTSVHSYRYSRQSTVDSRQATTMIIWGQGADERHEGGREATCRPTIAMLTLHLGVKGGPRLPSHTLRFTTAGWIGRSSYQLLATMSLCAKDVKSMSSSFKSCLTSRCLPRKGGLVPSAIRWVR